MVKAGDMISVVETGETFHFLQTAADTKGKLLRIQMYIARGGGAKAVPQHIHPIAEERFFVQKGRMWVDLNGEQIVYGPGSVIIVPPGMPHTWGDAEGQDLLEFIVELEPALRMEEMFEALGTASKLGKLSKSGKPAFLAMLLSIHTYPDHLYLAGVPVWLQKLVAAAFAPIARLMGHKAYLPYFEDEAQRQQAAVSHTAA